MSAALSEPEPNGEGLPKKRQAHYGRPHMTPHVRRDDMDEGPVDGLYEHTEVDATGRVRWSHALFPWEDIAPHRMAHYDEADRKYGDPVFFCVLKKDVTTGKFAQIPRKYACEEIDSIETLSRLFGPGLFRVQGWTQQESMRGGKPKVRCTRSREIQVMAQTIPLEPGDDEPEPEMVPEGRSPEVELEILKLQLQADMQREQFRQEQERRAAELASAEARRAAELAEYDRRIAREREDYDRRVQRDAQQSKEFYGAMLTIMANANKPAPAPPPPPPPPNTLAQLGELKDLIEFARDLSSGRPVKTPKPTILDGIDRVAAVIQPLAQTIMDAKADQMRSQVEAHEAAHAPQASAPTPLQATPPPPGSPSAVAAPPPKPPSGNPNDTLNGARTASDEAPPEAESLPCRKCGTRGGCSHDPTEEGQECNLCGVKLFHCEHYGDAPS